MKRTPSQTNEYLQKEVFEVHMKYVQNNLEGIRDMSIKIMDRLEKHEKTLYRNTLTVEEHHKRSNHIEQRQEEFLSAVRSIKDDIKSLVKKVDVIEYELEPIKTTTMDNAKVIGKVTWISEHKGLIIKSFVVSGVISIILYILLKDVEAVRLLLKAVF
jgi:chromosome segregation ATPase